MRYQRLQWLVIAATLTIMICAPLRAQERRLPAAAVVLGVGYDYGMMVPVNTLDEYTELTSELETKWVGFNLIFPKLFGNGFGISSSWSYGVTDLNFQTGGTEDYYNWNLGEFESRQIRQQVDARYRVIQTDLAAYIQAGSLVRLEIGPHGSIGFLPRYSALEWLTDTSTFSDGSRERSHSSDSDPNAVVVSGGLMMRASLEIPLLPGLALVPSAYARATASFTNLDIRDDDDYYYYNDDPAAITGSAGVGLGVIFGSTNGELIPPPPPPPLESPAAIPSSSGPTGADLLRETPPSPVPPALHARVELFSKDRSGNRADTFVLSTRRTLHRMHVPLVPVLYFNPNSAELPAHYTGYTRGTSVSFSTASLAGGSVADLYRHGLNIIGMRMAADPSAGIAVTGWTAPGEPKRLAKARAEAVQEYLAATWGIDRSRVRIVPAAGGRDAGDRIVSITSNTPSLNAPVITEWIEESVETPPVMLVPTITAAAGMRSWRAGVMHNGRQIGMLRSDGGEPEGTIDVAMVMGDFESGGSGSVLSAELIVEDSTGALTMARDTLPVTFGTVPAGEFPAERTISRHVLAAGGSAEETERTISAIVADINGDARIQVAPRVWGTVSADRDAASGTPDMGERLAYVGGQLRNACEREGKHITGFDLRSEAAPLDETVPAFPAPPGLAAPIEVTVIATR